MQYLALVYALRGFKLPKIFVSIFCTFCICSSVANIALDVDILIEKKPQFACTILVYDSK